MANIRFLANFRFFTLIVEHLFSPYGPVTYFQDREEQISVGAFACHFYSDSINEAQAFVILNNFYMTGLQISCTNRMRLCVLLNISCNLDQSSI